MGDTSVLPGSLKLRQVRDLSHGAYTCLGGIKVTVPGESDVSYVTGLADEAGDVRLERLHTLIPPGPFNVGHGSGNVSQLRF